MWNDTAMLNQFKECLDEANQTRLRARQKERPNLTLVEFKRELRQAFGIDAQRQYRRDWEAVTLTLSGPPGKELTLADWRKFEAKYKIYRSSVPERSATEEWRMIFSKLPEKIQEMVVKKQADLRRTRPWVRVSAPGMTTDDILALVEAHTGRPIPRHHTCAAGVVFEVTTSEDRDELIRLQNAETEDGHRITATQHEYEMSGDQIFAVITEKLTVDSELRLQQDLYGVKKPAQPTDTKVRPVASEEAKMQVVQFSGNTRTPKPNQGDKGRSGRSEHPKSQGRGSPAKRQNSDDTVCYNCRSAGREHVHDFRQCSHYKKAKEALAARSPSSIKKVCLTCKRANRQFDHDHLKPPVSSQ